VRTKSRLAVTALNNAVARRNDLPGRMLVIRQEQADAAAEGFGYNTVTACRCDGPGIGLRRRLTV
jgi:hypothetical protein